MSLEKNLKLLKLHSFFVDFIPWAPLAIIYFSHISGSYALGLSIFSINMISSAFFELPTGFISDKYGRVNTLIFGSLANFISAILYAIGQNYWFLVIGAIFGGLGRAFYSGNNDALLYDNLSEAKKSDEFSEHNGRISSMSQLSLAITSLLGGVIAYFSFSLLMWLSVFPTVICLIIGLKLKEVKSFSKETGNIFVHINKAFKNFKSNFKLRQISLVSIIGFGMGEAAWHLKSAFISTIWPIWAIGIAQFLSNVGATISFHFSGRIIKKYSAIKILIFENIVSKIINIPSLLFPSFLSPAIMSTTSLFFGISQVSKSNLLQKEFTNQQRAVMGSLNSLFGSIFYAIFAIILGLLADNFSPRNALIIETLLSCFVLIPLLRFKKENDKSFR